MTLDPKGCQELFRAIVMRAIEDLFGKEGIKIAKEAKRWIFEANTEFEAYCLHGDLDSKKWKYIANLIVNKQLTHTQYKTITDKRGLMKYGTITFDRA